MFDDLKNSFDFYLRNKFRISRKNFVETNKDLIERNRLENIYTKNILEKYFSEIKKDKINVLDIGCKNWFYAKGEHEFFENFCKSFKLDGVEIDAFRLYSNFYNRYEVSKYYTKGLNNTNYIAGNLLDLKEKYDYIIWLLPFVIKEPHIYWGLPEKYFYPKKLLAHAYNLLNKNGQMLIINQGEEEFEAQKILLQDLKIGYKDLGEITSDYFQYKNKRFGALIVK